jgi:hypothetical protein
MLDPNSIEMLAGKSQEFLEKFINMVDMRISELLSEHNTITEEGITVDDISAYDKCTPSEQQEIMTYVKLSSMITMLKEKGYYPSLIALISINTVVINTIIANKI